MVKYINRKTNKKKVINKKRKTNKKQRKVKKGGDDVNILKDLKAEKENKKTIADDKIFGIILGDKPEQVIAFKELFKYKEDFQKLTNPEFVDKKGNNIVLAILDKHNIHNNNSSLEMFKYLEKELDTKTFKKLINTPNANGVTALMHSIASSKNIELFKKVLFYSDDIEAMKDTFDRNIFFAFSRLFNISMHPEYNLLQLEKLQLLFDRIENKNKIKEMLNENTKKEQYQLLLDSIKDKNKVKEMLNKEAIDYNGETPVDKFVINYIINPGIHDIVQLFIKYGAQTNYPTVRAAQMEESLDIEYLLLKNGTSLSIDPKQSNVLLRIKIQRALVEESRIILAFNLPDGLDDDIEATANTFKYEDKVKKLDNGYVFCADKDKNNAVKFDGLYLKDGVETIQYSTDKTSEDDTPEYETPVSNFFMKYCYFFDGKEYHRINSYNTNISKPYEEAKTCIKKSR